MEEKKRDCGGTLSRCCSDVGAGVAAAVAAAAAAASGGGAGAVPAVCGHGEEAIGYAVMQPPVCLPGGRR